MVVLKLPFGITLHYSAFAETSILNSDNAVKSQFSKLNYQNLIIDVKSYFNSTVGPVRSDGISTSNTGKDVS